MTVHPLTPLDQAPRLPEQVFFDRRELGAILAVYGRMVAAGEMRDYGIRGEADVAMFSIFRRTAEYPAYRVEKRPRLRNRQGMYALIGQAGQVLRRGHDLTAVLRFLEQKSIRAVDWAPAAGGGGGRAQPAGQGQGASQAAAHGAAPSGSGRRPGP